MAAYHAVLDIGDTVLGLRLDHGGHLTHGHKVNFSGRNYHFVSYGVSPRDRAHRHRRGAAAGAGAPAEAHRHRRVGLPAGPRLRRLPRRSPTRSARCSWSTWPTSPGLVAAGLHPNPVEWADIVTSTTHKTLAGPRSGFVLSAAPSSARRSTRRSSPACRAVRCATPRPPRRSASRSPATDGLPRVPAAGARERRRAGRDAARGRPPARRRRHRHAPGAAQPARQPVVGQGRRGPHARRRPHGQPQRRALRRAPAGGLQRRAHRHPGGDHARPRRGRLPRGRGASSATCSRPTPTCRRWHGVRRRAARPPPAVRGAAAATRPSTASDGRPGPSACSPSASTRSCSTRSRCCATCARARATSASCRPRSPGC